MRKFFKKMERLDERIVDTQHIHRGVHLAKLMVQYLRLALCFSLFTSERNGW